MIVISEKTNTSKRRAKNEVVPSGEQFLPIIDLEDLLKMHKKEKIGKAKHILQVCTLRKEGKSIRSISRIVGIAYSTARNWLLRVHREGLKRRFDKKRLGRKQNVPKSMHQTNVFR